MNRVTSKQDRPSSRYRTKPNRYSCSQKTFRAEWFFLPRLNDSQLPSRCVAMRLLLRAGNTGGLFRRVRRRKYPEKTPAALSERMICHIVTKYARQTGLVNKLAPMI